MRWRQIRGPRGLSRALRPQCEPAAAFRRCSSSAARELRGASAGRARTVFAPGPMRGVSLDAWLGGTLPGNPAELARQAVRYLPDPCHADALRILGRAPVEDRPGTLGRVRDLAERSAPGDPQPREAELEEQRGTSSTERFEQFMGGPPPGKR